MRSASFTYSYCGRSLIPPRSRGPVRQASEERVPTLWDARGCRGTRLAVRSVLSRETPATARTAPGVSRPPGVDMPQRTAASPGAAEQHPADIETMRDTARRALGLEDVLPADDMFTL